MGSDPLACSHTHLRRRPPWLVCARGIASTPLLLPTNSPRYLPMKTIAFVLGALLIVVAVIYLTVPADSLPSFLPGHEVGLARPRMKHGMAAGAVGVILLVVGWVLGRR